MSCPFAALGACACAVSWPTWRLFTRVRAVCGACVLLVVVSLFFPPRRATPRTREKQRAPGPRHQHRPEKTDGLLPGSGCHGGLTVLPCGAMRGNRDNCSYSTTTLFVALIRTYTLMHSVLSRLCFASSQTLLHSKIKRIWTLRLGGKRKYVTCHAAHAGRTTNNLFTGPEEKCVLVFASFVR